jgi:aminodeoxyfutalosine deaminase
VRHLAAKQIPLEVSITSNLCTGAVRTLAEHPVRKLFDAGVPITLNTDDPGFFRTSLRREFQLARDVFGFSGAELEQVRENAFRFAVDAG